MGDGVMPSKGKEDPNSKAGRIREFFKNNPDEELTKEDVEVKFGLTQRQAGSALDNLRDAGFLESHHLYRLKK